MAKKIVKAAAKAKLASKYPKAAAVVAMKKSPKKGIK